MRDSAGIASPLSDPPKAQLMWSFKLGRFVPAGERYVMQFDEPRLAAHREARGWRLKRSGWHKPCGKCTKMQPLDNFRTLLPNYAGQRKAYSSVCRKCKKGGSGA